MALAQISTAVAAIKNIVVSIMDIEQTGIILFVENYEPCVGFYRDCLSLPVVHVQETLTTFALGAAYLMVERGGVACHGEKSRAQNSTILRFNVLDVHSAAMELRERGVSVEIHAFDWGVIGVFLDPDGNRCELKNAV